MLKLTYTAHGANLSNAEGVVTHTLSRPMSGLTTGWGLYAFTGPYSRKWVGTFPSAEAAKSAAEGSN